MIIATPEIACGEQVEWNVVYTRHQREKPVAKSLAGNGFEVFLPTYNVMRRWTDRKKRLSLPLFPFYVFVRSSFERRLRVLTTSGVHSSVMFAGRPTPIPDLEMDAIRKALESRLRVEPHAFLKCGDWVRIKSGPLADVESILVRKKSSYRLILSAELRGESIAVEIGPFSVEPTNCSRTRIPQFMSRPSQHQFNKEP
jgi:transcription antitermination factor NusG